MESYRLALSPSSTGTKVLLTHGPDELLKAILPEPSRVRHERAATTLIEALALWLDTTLPVAHTKSPFDERPPSPQGTQPRVPPLEALAQRRTVDSIGPGAEK